LKTRVYRLHSEKKDIPDNEKVLEFLIEVIQKI